MSGSGISLIIPVKDEARSVEALIRSIYSQTRLPDEVVFVDAGSTDDTVKLIRKNARPGTAVRVISIGAAYPGIARNAGAKIAENDRIAFTDAGIELDRDWLKELGEAMSIEPTAEVVYGNYEPKTDTLFKRCLAIAIVPPQKDAGGVKVRPRFLASSLLKKRVWEALGGFQDLRAAEDRIFMERIERDGYRTVRSPKARVVWDIPEDLKGVFKRFSSYSYHDLRAGRTKDWHLPVIRMYLAVAAFMALGAIFLPSSLLLLPVAVFLRVGKKIFINIHEPYFRSAEAPLYFFMSGFLMIFIDMAMFAGWVRYKLSKAECR